MDQPLKDDFDHLKKRLEDLQAKNEEAIKSFKDSGQILDSIRDAIEKQTQTLRDIKEKLENSAVNGFVGTENLALENKAPNEDQQHAEQSEIRADTKVVAAAQPNDQCKSLKITNQIVGLPNLRVYPVYGPKTERKDYKVHAKETGTKGKAGKKQCKELKKTDEIGKNSAKNHGTGIEKVRLEISKEIIQTNTEDSETKVDAEVVAEAWQMNESYEPSYILEDILNSLDKTLAGLATKRANGTKQLGLEKETEEGQQHAGQSEVKFVAKVAEDIVKSVEFTENDDFQHLSLEIDMEKNQQNAETNAKLVGEAEQANEFNVQTNVLKIIDGIVCHMTEQGDRNTENPELVAKIEKYQEYSEQSEMTVGVTAVQEAELIDQFKVLNINNDFVSNSTGKETKDSEHV